MKKKLSILCLILQAMMFNSVLYAQLTPLDQVTDTVWCRGEAGQSYALYLPADYDRKMNWPVILIFDPSARGTAGVSGFTEAARKYGFILACSNNSRNGPMANNFTAAAAMLRDVRERFSIDPGRIYTSGFSGGSRFAMAFAVSVKGIAGIIGCGAGLANDRTYLPSRNADFLYYGLVGTRDMNYLEMLELPDFFSKQTGVVSYLRVFQGGHEWPKPGLLTDAVEWIVLQAMKKGTIPSDQAFLSYLEKKTENLISSQKSSGDQYEAVRYIRFAIRDFQGTSFASGMTRLLSDSGNSSGYQAAIRKWNKMAATEEESREKYLIYLANIFKSGSVPDSALPWWKNEIRYLTRLRDKGNTQNSQMASRILNFISILCSEQGTALYRNRQYIQASFLFSICTFSDSENQYNYYNLAKSLACSGNSKESVDALAEAVKHGFNSRQTIESDPGFTGIRNDNRYKVLVNGMK